MSISDPKGAAMKGILKWSLILVGLILFLVTAVTLLKPRLP